MVLQQGEKDATVQMLLVDAAHQVVANCFPLLFLPLSRQSI